MANQSGRYESVVSILSVSKIRFAHDHFRLPLYAMAAELWTSYKHWADTQETLFLDWADPSGQYKLSPMQNLPGADFATAFAICVAYVAFVVIGTVR